jgi:hypothetical protein
MSAELFEGAAVSGRVRYGEAEIDIHAGAIGPIRMAGREAIRRIFVTVRDARWAEVAPSEWSVTRTAALTFHVEARHQLNAIDFVWTGTLRIEPERRSIQFDFAGQAEADFDVCRVGLVVLVAPEELDSSEIVASGSGGRQWLRLDGALQPQRIVGGLPTGITEPFTHLEVTTSDARQLSLGFHGDLFEIEDQRNWGDASFKIYCTPLRLGFPRRIARGAVVRQGVAIHYAPAAICGADAVSLETRGQNDRFPEVGADRHHGFRDDLWRYAAGGLGGRGWLGAQPLRELRLSSGAAANPETARHLAGCARDARRVLLHGERGGLPTRDDVLRLRRLLDANCARDAKILAASEGFFVEFNRGEPFAIPVDGVAFTLSPTVHAVDSATAFENVAALAPMVAAARAISGSAEVAIAPLAWRPGEADAALGIAAADLELWLVASLLSAARAGVSSVTLDADLARRVETDPALARTRALIGAFGVEAVAFPIAEVPGLYCAILRQTEGDRLVAVNLGPTQQSLLRPDMPGEIAVPALALVEHDLVTPAVQP